MSWIFLKGQQMIHVSDGTFGCWAGNLSLSEREHHLNLLHSYDDTVLCVVVTIRRSACVAGKDEGLHPHTNTARVVDLKNFISSLWIVDLLIHKEAMKFPTHLPLSCAWAWLILSVLLFLWTFSRELSRTFWPSFSHFTVGLSPELTWQGIRIRESGWNLVWDIPILTLISRILGLWGAAVAGRAL